MLAAMGLALAALPAAALTVTINPNTTYHEGATLFVTPWTPPAAMKTNNNRIGGSLLAARYADHASHRLSFASYMSSGNAGLHAISI